jgi:hypothetical protein
MRIFLLGLLMMAGGADSDGDSIPDEAERQILEKFLPRFHVAVGDCDMKPAEFERGQSKPVLKARNGTIHGQVFPVEGGVEVHYYHLWSNDCGRIQHPLDAEHVSGLLVQMKGEWRAQYWYSAAHEDTICDRGLAARASEIYAEWRGPDVWVSRGKHASFLSEAACRLGCGSDKCDRSERLVVQKIVNLGEPGKLADGMDWVRSDAWPLREKMGSDFPLTLRSSLDDSRGIIAVTTPNRIVAQPVILAGSSTIDALSTANAKTEGALAKSKKKVKAWLEAHWPKR